MAKDKIKRSFSEDEIIKLVLELGSKDFKRGINGELIFQTVCHHGRSYKLYYYPDSGLFHCYTDCADSFDVYELVMRSRDCEFSEALGFVNHLFDLDKENRRGFVKAERYTDDWEIIKRYSKPDRASEDFAPVYYPSSLIDYYSEVNPVEWLQEGITVDTMRKFKIRFDVAHNRIVIPQFDQSGKLIGIRGRALDWYEVEQGRKYMPVSIEKTFLRHPTMYSLYGLYENQAAIRRLKKIMIFEAEKSVMKCDGYYGENNFTVAVCGSSISIYQRNLILSLGVKEVFLAFDRDYNKDGTKESEEYAEKILNQAYKFCPYVTTYVLWDTKQLIRYKDSPADQGKKILEELMKTKYEVTTREEEQ